MAGRMDIDRRRPSRSRSPTHDDDDDSRDRGRSRSPQRRRSRSNSPQHSRSRSRGRKLDDLPKSLVVPDPFKVEVKFTPKQVDKQHIEEIFGHYGDIIDVRRQDTRFGRGVGGASSRMWFVNYMSEESAKTAILRMHGGKIADRVVSVDLASQRIYPDRLQSEERAKVIEEYERRNRSLEISDSFAPDASAQFVPEWAYGAQSAPGPRQKRGNRFFQVDEPPPSGRYRGDYR